MKNYIRLSIDAVAYYSGNTYYEEVFLPEEVWNEIKDDFQMYTYLCEFDGKHSEVKVDIEVDECSENYLTTYKSQGNDGETLFDHIYEYLDEEKYDNRYLLSIQEEVESLCQVEKATIKFNKKDRETIFNLIKDYLIN